MITVLTGRTAHEIHNKAMLLRPQFDECVVWPEILEGNPLHPSEIVDRVKKLVQSDKRILVLTLNEIVIVTFQHLVRKGQLGGFLVLFINKTKTTTIEVDIKGEFIQPWPEDKDSLFETAFYLRFFE